MAGKLPSRARDTYACNLYVLATRRAAVGTPRILSAGGEINFRRFFLRCPGIAGSLSTFRVANRTSSKTFFPVGLLCFPSGPVTKSPEKKLFENLTHIEIRTLFFLLKKYAIKTQPVEKKTATRSNIYIYIRTKLTVIPL